MPDLLYSRGWMVAGAARLPSLHYLCLSVQSPLPIGSEQAGLHRLGSARAASGCQDSRHNTGIRPKRYTFECSLNSSYFAQSPENFCGSFFEFAWEFCIEKWRGFLVNFFWSPFPTKRSTKNPQKIRGNSEQNSGQNSGRKFEKFRKLSFWNFLRPGDN